MKNFFVQFLKFFFNTNEETMNVNIGRKITYGLTNHWNFALISSLFKFFLVAINKLINSELLLLLSHSRIFIFKAEFNYF
jgi:hypothetical protein